MLQSLKKLMGAARSADAGSVELASALDLARKEIVAANDRHEAAGRAYSEGLLTLDDSELQKLIDARHAATIQRDRAQVLVSTLEAKLLAAQEAEAIAALTTERDAAEKEAAAVAALVREQYPKLAGALVTMLDRLTAADEAASAVNKKLSEAGRHAERVQDVQVRVLPNHPDFSIWGTTQLQEFPGFAPGWRSAIETWPGNSPLINFPGPRKVDFSNWRGNTQRDDRPFGGHVDLSNSR